MASQTLNSTVQLDSDIEEIASVAFIWFICALTWLPLLSFAWRWGSTTGNLEGPSFLVEIFPDAQLWQWVWVIGLLVVVCATVLRQKGFKALLDVEDTSEGVYVEEMFGSTIAVIHSLFSWLTIELTLRLILAGITAWVGIKVAQAAYNADNDISRSVIILAVIVAGLQIGYLVGVLTGILVRIIAMMAEIFSIPTVLGLTGSLATLGFLFGPIGFLIGGFFGFLIGAWICIIISMLTEIVLFYLRRFACAMVGGIAASYMIFHFDLGWWLIPVGGVVSLLSLNCVGGLEGLAIDCSKFKSMYSRQIFGSIYLWAIMVPVARISGESFSERSGHTSGNVCAFEKWQGRPFPCHFSWLRSPLPSGDRHHTAGAKRRFAHF